MNTCDYIGGRYKIIKDLGKGGFGCTYLAKDSRKGVEYAVKKLTFAKNDSRFPKAKELFFREVETMKKLNHPQIPKFIEDLEIDQELYLIQEYIPGLTLDQEIKSGKQYNEDEIIFLLQEILDILQYIHSKKVIHRDIKPTNIIRRKNDHKLVLIDYGGVKYIAKTKFSQSQTPITVIDSGDYTPQEQKDGNPQLCSDIYAVGVTAIAAITNNQFTRQNGEINCDNIAQISPELKTVLSKMVKYLYQYRYQTVEEVLSDLKNIKKPQSSQVTQVITVTPTAIRKSPILEIVAVVIVIVSIYALCAAAGKTPVQKERKFYQKTISSELLLGNIITKRLFIK